MQKNFDLPLIPLRGLTVFPNTTVNFDVGRKKSVAAVTDAVKNRNGKIILCRQTTHLSLRKRPRPEAISSASIRLFIAARQGDPVGQRICDEYVSYLACGIVNVVNVFQPDALAIGGGVSNEADEQLLLPVQRCVERESIPCAKNRRTRIVKAVLGNQAGIIGAALLGKNKRI